MDFKGKVQIKLMLRGRQKWTYKRRNVNKKCVLLALPPLVLFNKLSCFSYIYIFFCVLMLLITVEYRLQHPCNRLPFVCVMEDFLVPFRLLYTFYKLFISS